MSEQTSFVGPKRAAEKMARTRAIPGMSDRVAAIRADMAEADRVYAENLAAIRRAADLTQVALAEQMGVAQTVVSRLERQHDMLLSTLSGYLKAAGSHPRVVVTINGRDVELDLDSLVK
jgi:ribosome-binding protein aMBF1 (putative translation factor)